MRAKEPPTKRPNLLSLLKANFKRVEEALRVLEEYTGKPIYNKLRYDVYDLEKDLILGLEKKQIFSGVYVISDSVSILEESIKKGASLVQLRDKKGTKSQIHKKAKQMAPLAKKHGVPFIVNDFLDIAMDVDADGIHTGQDDLPLDVIRNLWGPHKIIGRTTHDLSQGKKAQKEGADYISIGPIWETPSKPGRKAIGLNYLKKAKKELSIPVVAIGGINLENMSVIIAQKPALIGIIRAHKDIPQIIKALHPNKT